MKYCMLWHNFKCLIFLIIVFCLPIAAENYNNVLIENNSEYNSDINFKVLSKYYGLSTKIINLSTCQLNDSIFRNGDGEYIKSICISYKNLEDTILIDNNELGIIKSVIQKGNNLIINDISDSLSAENIKVLTDSQYVNAVYFHNSDGWKFNQDNNNISDVLFNTNVSSDTSFYNAYVININNSIDIITDKNGVNPIFSYINLKDGKIFFNGNIISENLNNRQLWNMYYGYSYLCRYIQNILPIMLFLKYSNNNMCWHNDHKYANLTIDDPYFIEPYYNLNFHNLLNEMNEHNFHTTIAFIPKHFNDNFDTSVVNIFKEYPDRYSIVQHGNNHDGYEFICYTQEQLDTLNEIYDNIWINQKPRPYKDQECDIVEGITKLDYLYGKTGVYYGRIMIFPYGISLSPTLEILKKYNFNVTINGQYRPYLLIAGDCDTTYDFYMRAANMGFGNFAVCSRRWPYFSGNLNNPNYLRFKLNLLINKQILAYTHEGLFLYGQDAFNVFADSINTWYPDIEWHSLDYIIKRLYIEKLNFDSTIDVQFYGNDLIVSNETDKSNIYHLQKYEIGNVPIYNIKVDNQLTGYTLINDTLLINVEIDAHSEREIIIRYYSSDKDYSVNDNVKFENINDTLYFNFLVSNMGVDSGACPICVYYNDRNKDTLIYLSAVYFDSYGSKMIHVPLSNSFNLQYGKLIVKLDQYNLIDEIDEANNNYTYSMLKIYNPDYILDIKIRELSVDNINFNVIVLSKTDGTLDIFDITGRKLFKNSYTLNIGKNDLKWDYSKFHKGIYFAKFKIGTAQKILKFIKY